VRRGDVYWLDDPHAKWRPVCILTRSEAIPVLTQLTVVEATRTIRGIPTEVGLDRDDGMPQACVLSLDSVNAVPKRLLTRRITTLTPARMHEVCAALRIATGC
jgi:mRNA interferase MazF